MQFSPKDAARFKRKVLERGPDECWLWQAALNTQRMGYGAFGLGRQVIAAHRFAYMLAFEKIPAGACVMHRCDNPRCVNPKHLTLGSYADNNHDMVLKGRAARKLTPESVRKIRGSSLSSRALASKYEVSQHMIMRVLHRKAWAQVA